MAKENTCCFTGHRIISVDFDSNTLMRGIEYLIGLGVDTFICGGAMGFDTVCAEAVLRARIAHPHISLHIYAPCCDQSSRWSIKDKLTYERILEKADFVDMPSVPYFDGCMKIRNCKMVDASAYCICYMNNTHSGTGQTYRYAVNHGLTVYNIAGKK